MDITRKPKEISKLERRQLERTQEVLAMRNVMKQAETLQGRDQQLREKDKKQAYELEYEQRMHDMMEADRVAAMQRMMKQEELDMEKGRERALVIDRQLQDRQNQRLRAADEVEFQKDEFRQMCEAREKEELVKKQAKAKVSRQRREELVKANQLAMREKMKRQELERQADLAIVEYQKHKAWEEEMREEEKQRIRKEKDAEFQKMLLAQERIVDGRSQEDENRMMAAFRVKEKAYRTKVKREKEAKAKSLSELKTGWQDQVRQKAIIIARQAEQDRWETTAQELSALAIQEQLDSEVAAKKAAAYKNKDMLCAQMTAKDTARQRSRRHHLEVDHGKLQKEQGAQNAKIEKIRQESIAKMKKAGIPQKYWKKLENQTLGLARQITPSDERW